MKFQFGENQNSINIIEQFLKYENITIIGTKQLISKIDYVLKEKYNKTVIASIEYTSSSISNINKTDKFIIASYHEIDIAYKLINEYDFKYGDNFIFFDHILLLNYFPFNSIGYEFKTFLNKNEKQFKKVFDILEDEYSKSLFYKVLNLRVNLLNIENILPVNLPTPYDKQLQYEQNASLYLEELSLVNNQSLKEHISFTMSLNSYSYFDIVTPKNKYAIINAGAYNTTSVMFTKYSPSAKIYAFEPQNNIHNDNVLLSNNYPNIIPIHKGVWSETKSLSFNIIQDEETASSIDENGNVFIDVVSIDSYCKQNNINNIDFIKMDIEGAEIEALLGASEIIQTLKPDLAISIYHKPEHLYEIPILIKKLLPEYKIYIDHKYYNYTETVCFATIK